MEAEKTITQLESKIASEVFSNNRAIAHFQNVIQNKKLSIAQCMNQVDVGILREYRVNKCANERLFENITRMNKRIEEIREVINSFDQENSDQCPTCKREYSPEHKAHALEKQKEAYKDLEAYISASNTAQWAYEKLQDTVSDQEIASNGVKYFVKQIKEYNSSIRSCTESIAELSKQNNTVQYSQRLKEVKAEEDPTEEPMNRVKERIRISTNQKKGIIVEARVLREDLEHLNYWQDKFKKDLRLSLLSKAVDYLNKRVHAHLNGLNNSNFHVHFSLKKQLVSGEKDDLGISVWSDRGGVGYDTLSGGEQQIVNFAVGLALSDLASTQVIGPSGLMVLDEPFENLSPNNCEAVVNYLNNTLVKKKQTLMLITNNDELQSLVSNQIHVEKQNGISALK